MFIYDILWALQDILQQPCQEKWFDEGGGGLQNRKVFARCDVTVTGLRGSLLLGLREDTNTPQGGLRCGIQLSAQHTESFWRKYRWQMIFLLHICPSATLKTDGSLPLWGWRVPLTVDLLGWELLPAVKTDQKDTRNARFVLFLRCVRDDLELTICPQVPWKLRAPPLKCKFKSCVVNAVRSQQADAHESSSCETFSADLGAASGRYSKIWFSASHLTRHWSCWRDLPGTRW